MRDEKGRWLPGASVNARGRAPRGFTIAEQARDQVERRKLIEKLGEMAERPGDDQIAAMHLLLAYGYGLPKAEIETADEATVVMWRFGLGAWDTPADAD
jgi:hypothetical protein